MGLDDFDIFILPRASVRNDWCFFDAWKRKEEGPMYPVSEAFLQAVQENTRKYYWMGKITTAAGAEYPFTQEDVVKGRDGEPCLQRFCFC